MSGSCCARLRRANVEFAAVERPSKAVVPKSVQIASAVAYASAHEAMCCTRKNTVGERSGAAKLRSGAASRVFACAAQASCAAAQATALAIWTDFGTTAFDSLSTAANSTFARCNRAQQLPDILGRRDAKNFSCKRF